MAALEPRCGTEPRLTSAGYGKGSQWDRSAHELELEQFATHFVRLAGGATTPAEQSELRDLLIRSIHHWTGVVQQPKPYDRPTSMWLVHSASPVTTGTTTIPSTTAIRAAKLIHGEFARRWCSEAIAERLQVSPTQLRLEFKAVFGMSMVQYQTLVRMNEALKRIASEKVEMVALAVGYKSKKNFYRAFRSSTGLLPCRYRELAESEARVLRDAIALRLRETQKIHS